MSARAWRSRRYKLHGYLTIFDCRTGAVVTREQMSEQCAYDAVWTPLRPIDRQRTRRVQNRKRP